MFDPTVGRWLEEDPIGFEGGDANLYRFVGNSPTNFTDPSGLKFSMKVGDEWKEGKEAEDLFFKQLGDTDALKRVIKALRENAEFKKIWDYLRQSEWDIELKVTPGLTKPGTKVQIFGGFFRHKLELNPTMPKIKDNPLELADTLIHEAIHAAIFILDQTREKKTYPRNRSADFAVWLRSCRSSKMMS
jgi:hypothetical protein